MLEEGENKGGDGGEKSTRHLLHTSRLDMEFISFFCSGDTGMNEEFTPEP